MDPIEKFLSVNKDVKRINETDHIILENLWGDDTFICRFDKTIDFKPLENIELPAEFSALFHVQENTLEFIYNTLPENEIIERKFMFYYAGLEFEVSFGEASKSLEILATAFREISIKTDTDYRNLKILRDYYRVDKTEGMKRFFADKKPISFFVKGDFCKINKDFIGLSKHMNFYMRYFDRKAPMILIFDDDKSKEKYELPCHTGNKHFPDKIRAKKIEPVILDLLHIASLTTNIRLKYIFYYQILEYCSYYHLNDELKRKLNNIVKNPDVLNDSGNYSRQIIDQFKNYFKANDDKQKLEKLIFDHLDYNDIKLEIKCNYKYFSQDFTFDGDFKIEALIKNQDDAENPPKDILKSIVDRIDKIRNVLVHIRESRENKVILPTAKNNHQLIPYFYLIRRIAEVIAIKYE